jgi:hypothetical protein
MRSKAGLGGFVEGKSHLRDAHMSILKFLLCYTVRDIWWKLALAQSVMLVKLLFDNLQYS